jgi:hypothetical protein
MRGKNSRRCPGCREAVEPHARLNHFDRGTPRAERERAMIRERVCAAASIRRRRSASGSADPRWPQRKTRANDCFGQPRRQARAELEICKRTARNGDRHLIRLEIDDGHQFSGIASSRGDAEVVAGSDPYARGSNSGGEHRVCAAAGEGAESSGVLALGAADSAKTKGPAVVPPAPRVLPRATAQARSSGTATNRS